MKRLKLLYALFMILFLALFGYVSCNSELSPFGHAQKEVQHEFSP